MPYFFRFPVCSLLFDILIVGCRRIDQLKDRLYCSDGLRLSRFCFNQQVYRRSHQPIHYHVFDYVFCIGSLCGVGALWRSSGRNDRPKTPVLDLLVAIFWGLSSVTIRYGARCSNPNRQGCRLTAFWTACGEASRPPSLLECRLTGFLLTIAVDRAAESLWARHQHFFAGCRE